MTLASRFLSANSEDAAVSDVKKKVEGSERRNPAVMVPEPEKGANPVGRPGQIFVKVRKATNLPSAHGMIHRFVEVEFSGWSIFIWDTFICFLRTRSAPHAQAPVI